MEKDKMMIFMAYVLVAVIAFYSGWKAGHNRQIREQIEISDSVI